MKELEVPNRFFRCVEMIRNDQDMCAASECPYPPFHLLSVLSLSGAATQTTDPNPTYQRGCRNDYP